MDTFSTAFQVTFPGSQSANIISSVLCHFFFLESFFIFRVPSSDNQYICVKLTRPLEPQNKRRLLTDQATVWPALWLGSRDPADPVVPKASVAERDVVWSLWWKHVGAGLGVWSIALPSSTDDHSLSEKQLLAWNGRNAYPRASKSPRDLSCPSGLGVTWPPAIRPSVHSGAPSLNGKSTAGSRYTRTWPRHQGPHSRVTAFSSRPHLRPTGSSPPGARRGREVCAGCPRGPARRAVTAPQWTAAAPQPLPGHAGRTRRRDAHESRQTWGTKRRNLS